MKSNKELFGLAKNYSHLENRFELAATEEDIEDVKEDMEEILSILLSGKYDMKKFVHYKKMCKEMTAGEYLEFIKILE